MRSATYGAGECADPTKTHIPAAFLSVILGKWQDYRNMRDIESLPYPVMKDIGFRATERADEK